MSRRSFVLATLVCPLAAWSAIAAQDLASPIVGNSFLLEEGINQEAGVVQHIGTFRHTDDDSWAFTFTQEWPVGSQRHQVSYSVPVLRTLFGETGVGDVMIHYRYQMPRPEPQLAIAPRISLSLPTGSDAKGTGRGSMAIEGAIPASYVLNDYFMAHTNGGVTVAPWLDDGRGSTLLAMDMFLGQSLVYMPTPRFNVLMEIMWRSEASPLGDGQTLRSAHTLFAPGVRGVFELRNGARVVPGIAVPVGRDTKSVFLYLSAEHGFSR